MLQAQKVVRIERPMYYLSRSLQCVRWITLRLSTIASHLFLLSKASTLLVSSLPLHGPKSILSSTYYLEQLYQDVLFMTFVVKWVRYQLGTPMRLRNQPLSNLLEQLPSERVWDLYEPDLLRDTHFENEEWRIALDCRSTHQRGAQE